MSRLTVATLNLRGRHDRWLERRELIVAQLLDTLPDLISLQEIYRPIRQGRWLVQQINNRLSGSSARPYRLIQKRKHHWIKGYFEGIGILSKLPILSRDALALGYGGRVALRASVALSWRETLDFVAVHLHHEAEAKEARLEQVMRLVGWLQKSKPVPMQVIAGDFNEVPTGPAIRHLTQAYQSAFVKLRGYDPIATFPTALATRPNDWSGCLDYIFVSNAVDSVVDARLFCHRPDRDDPTLYPSDHVGLLVTLNT